MKRILNLGARTDFYGTDRIDIQETPSANIIMDLDNNIFPFEDNTFDEIRSYRLLEHIKNLDLFIKECYRVLKVGGKIDLITDYAGYIFFYIKPSSEHNRWIEDAYKKDGTGQNPDDHHYHLFVESHLRYLFREFKIKKIKYIKNPHWWKYIILSLLPFNMGAAEIQVIAEK